MVASLDVQMTIEGPPNPMGGPWKVTITNSDIYIECTGPWYPGETFTVTATITNTGDVDVDSIGIRLWGDPAGQFHILSGDNAQDVGLLHPNEYTEVVWMIASTIGIVIVHGYTTGLDPDGNVVAVGLEPPEVPDDGLGYDPYELCQETGVVAHFSPVDCIFPTRIGLYELFTPYLTIYPDYVYRIKREGDIVNGDLVEIYVRQAYIHCEPRIEDQSLSPFVIAYWVRDELFPNTRVSWYPPQPVTIERFTQDLAFPHLTAEVVLDFWVGFHCWWRRKVEGVTTETGEFDVFFQNKYTVTVEVDVPSEEVYPDPEITQAYISKTTVAPDEQFTITLTVHNRSDTEGAFYLGYSCLPGVPWNEEIRETIGADETRTYELPFTAESLAGRVFETSQYISARFAVGFVEPTLPRPDTETFTWTTPGIAVIVTEPPPPKADLYGIVMDKDSIPIVGAIVKIGSRTIESAANGAYSFVDIDPGSYTITCTKEGYWDYTASISLVKGDNTKNITLTPTSEPQPPPEGEFPWLALGIGTGALAVGYMLTRRK